MIPYRVIVSISYGPLEGTTAPVRTTHIMTFNEVALTEEQAKQLADGMVDALCMDDLAGIYKTEYPATAGVNLSRQN